VFGGTLADREPPHQEQPHREQLRREQLRAAARVLEAAAPLARRLGVAIGVETHDDFSASSVVAELLALTDPGPDPAWVGAVWDSHHPHRMGERPAEVYANLSPRILLAQVKDARRTPGGGWQLVLLGAGEVPVADMLGLLMAGGYPHWISVEWEKHWHPEIEAPEIALPQHLELLTSWLEAAQ
jgi:sugar phosphate isomerase/epimerase